jgi:chromosome segregation ATPase
MAALARQQQALTQQTSTLLMPGLVGRAREERARIAAEEQARIAEELRELNEAREPLLARPEELAREAEEIARKLSSTAADAETLERQRRLFRRMLDAGRSLEQEDLDPTRRESRTAEQPPHEIPEIDSRLLDGPRFPHPSEALIRRLPAYYRALIFDYFDRLNALRPPPSPEESR